MTLQVIIIWWMRDERLGCVITSFTQCLLSWRQCWWCSTCLHPHRLSTVFQLSFRSCMNLGNTWKWSDRKLHYWHIRLEARLEMLFTWWTWNCWTTLVIFLFHNTILPNWFDERTNPERSICKVNVISSLILTLGSTSTSDYDKYSWDKAHL